MPTPTGPSPDTRPQYADIAADALVQVGFVYKPHGLEGELKINPKHTDDPRRFETLSDVFFGSEPRHVTRHAIRSVRYQETKRGTTVLLGVEGIATRSDAESVTKLDVFAAKDDLSLADDEVFVHQLVGLAVVTADGERIGTVSNYLTAPAQDTFVVRRPNEQEAMIPAVDEFILDIDLDERCLTVELIDGLIE